MFVPERGRVLVSGRFEPDERERIRTAAAGVPVDFVDGLGDRTDLLGTATVIAGTLSGEQLALAPAVRWVHSWAAGVNNDLAAGLDAHPAVLTSSAGNGAVPLAEHAMMLMLMLNRNAPRWARAQSEHRWERFQHGELNGLTCGIIGLGNCGLDLAAKARAFGHEPRVALMSFSNFGNPLREKAERIRKAVEVLDSRDIDFEYDGEMSADVALDPEVRKLYPFCRLTGPANVLVTPARTSASLSTKLIKQLTGTMVIGPIVTGLEKPVQPYSMTAGVSEILQSAVLAACHMG